MTWALAGNSTSNINTRHTTKCLELKQNDNINTKCKDKDENQRYVKINALRTDREITELMEWTDCNNTQDKTPTYYIYTK